MLFEVCKPSMVRELFAGGLPSALCTGSKTSTLAEPPTSQSETAPASLPGLLPLLLPLSVNLSLFASIMPTVVSPVVVPRE